jgi:hypothetical protein
MTLNIGPFSVALTTNSLWLEAGKLSLHLTRDRNVSINLKHLG